MVRSFYLPALVPALAACDAFPSAPPKFEDAIECAALNALIAEEEPDSEEAELVELWLAFAQRAPDQSIEAVQGLLDKKMSEQEKRFSNMSDTEMLKAVMQDSARCVTFETDYLDTLKKGVPAKS